MKTKMKGRSDDLKDGQCMVRVSEYSDNTVRMNFPTGIPPVKLQQLHAGGGRFTFRERC